MGKGWGALLTLAFTPLYIQFLGMDAYGLVGFFNSLFILSTILDLGLSGTLNREMARLSVQEEQAAVKRDFLRTIEVLYWAIASVLGIALIVLSSLIASTWFKTDVLTFSTLKNSLVLMSLTLSVQLPFLLYSGGLMGLQRQVLLNGVVIAMATLRSGGAVLVLWLVSPTIEVFFGWQLLISFLQTAITGKFLWGSLQKAERRPRFDKLFLKRIWRFALGLSGISILGLILMQLDKVILSKLLSLEMFGYYCLASMVANCLYIFSVPISSTYLPRFSQLVALSEERSLIDLYHKSCKQMSGIILPVAIVVALFSKEILLQWTGNLAMAKESCQLVSLLIFGTALNGLMQLPSTLQIAYGHTKYIFYQNVGALIVLGPFIIWATSYYGVMGAAYAWAILNLGYVIFGISIMHTKIAQGEKMRWYLEDIGVPLVGALMIPLLARLLLPKIDTFFLMAAVLIAITILSMLSTLGVIKLNQAWKKKWILRGS